MMLLAQSEKITNWLTPVWTLSTGIGLGFLTVIVIWLLFVFLGRVKGVNTLHKTSAGLVASIALSVAIFCLLFFGFSYPRGFWSQGDLSSADWGRQLMLLSVFYGGGSLLLGFGTIAAVSKKNHSEISTVLWNGVLYWTSFISLIAIAFAALGIFLASNDGFGRLLLIEKPNEIFDSLVRLPVFGEETTKVVVNGGTPLEGEFFEDITVDGTYLRWIRVQSNQPVELASRPFSDSMPKTDYFDIPASDDEKIFLIRPDGTDKRIPSELVNGVYINNQGTEPAEISLTWFTGPNVPESIMVLWAAFGVVVFYLSYMFLMAGVPKIFAVAQSTFKTEVSQPVFLILLSIGCVFVVASIYIPYNTFGEDIKMYKDSGLTLVRVLGVFLAVWAASKSLAEEIEGRTALTVLSKPVSRRQFILGKYVGIGMTIALLFILVGLVFFVATAYKPVYDSGESTVRDFAWQTCQREAGSMIPGMVLAYLEAMIFAAISVVISTRLGILANFLICFSIYILGHLTPLIVQSAEVAQSFEGVVVFGQLISIIFPVLDHFDINAAITGGVPVPAVYLGWAIIYSALYGLIALLLALVFFEDRDLA